MEIGIDGGCLSNRRGFGRFARQLLGALATYSDRHHFKVFIDRPSAAHVEIPPCCERIVVNVSEAPSKAASAHGRRSWRDMISMGWAVARSGIDLMYFPATYSFFPVWNVPRLVVTMHDTLPLTHPQLVFPRASGRIAWRLKEAVALRWADQIVTVSHTSAHAIRKWLGNADPRIRVITEGPDAIFRPRAHEPGAREALARHAIPSSARYLLYVGGLSPHKNLIRLIEGFASGAPADVNLVLSGDVQDVFHTHVPEIHAAIDRHRLSDRVFMPGFVPDDDLVYLYSRATALVLPSLMEGFGLPAVESMACGTPVIASRAGSLPEIVGDAGLYFDPTDVNSISKAIEAFLTDDARRMTLAQTALDRAALFTWEAAASKLIACFEERPRNERPRGLSPKVA